MAHVTFCGGGLLIDLYRVDHPVSLRKSRRILRNICIASASHGSTSTVRPDFARPLVRTLAYLPLRTELIGGKETYISTERGVKDNIVIDEVGVDIAATSRKAGYWRSPTGWVWSAG
jgi:hypothetical protein